MEEVMVELRRTKPEHLRVDNDQVGYRQRREDILYVDLEDPEDPSVLYRWDVTFMLSTYRCTYGEGCHGIYGKAVNGCCDHGTELDWDDGELDRVTRHVNRLTPADWQHYVTGNGPNGWTATRGKNVLNTRVIGKACIFANDEKFAGGSGCALHIGALRAGEDFRDWKPTPCNTWPMSTQEITEHDDTVDVTIVGPLSSYDWNPDSHWWCTEAPENLSNHDPVYVSLKEELIIMVGEERYNQFVNWLTNNFVSVDYTPTQWGTNILPEEE